MPMALRLTVAVFLVIASGVVRADASPDPDAAAKIVAVTHLRRGDALRDRGRLDEAVREYDLGILAFPGAANLYASRGAARYLQKNYRGAAEDFSVYLTAAPSDTKILLLRGLSRSLQNPEDVKGACADLLRIQALGVSLKSAGIGGMDKYCQGQEGWGGN